MLAAVAIVGGAVFVWSGYYNVAASRQHLQITNWLLTIVRDQSIDAYSDDTTVPRLDIPGLAALGEGHYRAGCAFCHGMPGGRQNPIVPNMLPKPPDLANASSRYEPRELHWIVDHGLKFTGMPAWPARERGDEVWSVVAYLLEAGKQAKGGGPAVAEAEGPPGPAESGGVAERDGGGETARERPAPLGRIVECETCHGRDGASPIAPTVPVIAGLSEPYLARALSEFRSGRRPSGIMQVAAGHLEDDDILRLARHFARRERKADAFPFEAGADRDEATGDLARGETIAREGLPAKGVPACLSCHSGPSARLFASLDGQPATYLGVQLRLWRKEVRTGTGYGAIMATIAERLDEKDIPAVSRYFASRGLEDGR